jgi:predicted ATP-grasp superfamily ATP-dependent carboligase
MTRNNKTPVLILSAHTIALGVVRSLSPLRVPVYLVSYDKKDMAHKSKYIAGHYTLPHPENNAPAFIEGLLEIGRQIGKAIVYPSDDATLVTLSKNLEVLSPSFFIPTPDWSVIRNVINKHRTYPIAERAGIPIPKTLRLDTAAPLPPDLLQDFRFPFLIKPSQSHLYYETFHRKMDVVNTLEELQARFQVCREKQIDITAQQIIPGDVTSGLNFNSLFYDGEIKQGFVAHKVRMTENGYGIPTVVRSREIIAELWDYSEKLLRALNYKGYSCIEYKQDQQTGVYNLLEINGRYNRSSLLSVKAGINFPLIEYNYLVNGQDFSQQNYRSGIYYIDEFKDFQVNWGSVLRGKQGLAAFLKPYCSKHINAVFSLNDPKPFLKRTGDGLRLIT